MLEYTDSGGGFAVAALLRLPFLLAVGIITLHEAQPTKYWYNSKFEFMRKLFLWNYLVGWASKDPPARLHNKQSHSRSLL